MFVTFTLGILLDAERRKSDANPGMSPLRVSLIQDMRLDFRNPKDLIKVLIIF